MLERRNQKEPRRSNHFSNETRQKKLHFISPCVEMLFRGIFLPSFDLQPLRENEHQVVSSSCWQDLCQVLQKWNKTLNGKGEALLNTRAEFFRNRHIYNTMKNLLFEKQNLALTHVRSLYQWYKDNSEQKENGYNFGIKQSVLEKVKRRKDRIIDQQSEVRKTYKSNLPLEINDYHRKLLAPIQGTSPFFNNQNPKKVFSPQAALRRQKNSKEQISLLNKQDKKNYMLFNTLRKDQNQGQQFQNKYYSNRNYQSELIRNREVDEVRFLQTQWKSSKARFGHQTSKDFFKGFLKTDSLQRANRKILGQDRNNNTSNSFYKVKRAKINNTLGIRTYSTKTAAQETYQVKNNDGDIYNIEDKDKSVKHFRFLQDEVKLTSNVNGIGLMLNPYEPKSYIDKKRR